MTSPELYAVHPIPCVYECTLCTIPCTIPCTMHVYHAPADLHPAILRVCHYQWLCVFFLLFFFFFFFFFSPQVPDTALLLETCAISRGNAVAQRRKADSGLIRTTAFITLVHFILFCVPNQVWALQSAVAVLEEVGSVVSERPQGRHSAGKESSGCYSCTICVYV